MPSDAFFQRKGTAARLSFAAEALLSEEPLSSEDRKFYENFVKQRLKQALLLLLSRKDAALLEKFLTSFQIPSEVLREALLATAGQDQADPGCCGLLIGALGASLKENSLSPSIPPIQGMEAAALEILSLLKEQCSEAFPSLSGAFCLLKPRTDASLTAPMAGDGTYLFFHPERLCRQFARDSLLTRLAFLHIHLHCLLLHPVQRSAEKQKDRDERCDWQVNRLLSGGLLPASWLPPKGLPSPGWHPDSHACWYKKSPGETSERARAGGASLSSREELYRVWHPYTVSAGLVKSWESSGQRRQVSSAGGAASSARLLERDRYQYRQFLERFACPREELLLDADSFDYIPYCYGLSHYGNLPFLEPLEYQEVNRLDEFAIAIDTSGSCSGVLVRRFLDETWSLLRQKENFFKKMKLHFIQCDSMIQEYKVFTGISEWEEYLSSLKILGQGGTDFRPVFSLLEEKMRKKEIQNLRALLYFTDGDGIYPSRKPPFETAFVFLNRESQKQEIPPWAVLLNLGLPSEVLKSEESETPKEKP